MKAQYNFVVTKFKELKEIPNSRLTEDFLSLLETMEFTETQGMQDDEIKDICLMSLQDLGANAAAKIILKQDFKKRLSDGQINNIANEMLDEKLWEEYADPSLHEKFFISASLLYQAFPREFPKPDAASIDIEIIALNNIAIENLQKMLQEEVLITMLIEGMDDHSPLIRLYGDQIKQKSFKDSDSILWTVTKTNLSAEKLHLNIISSGYWLDSLKDITEFDACLNL